MSPTSSNYDASSTPADHRRASVHGEDEHQPDPIGKDGIGIGYGRRWPIFVIGGASLLAGMFAIAAPLVAGFAVTLTLGICLVFCGAIGVVGAFRERDHWHIAGAFALSLLAVLAGVLMLLQPATGIVAIGTLIIAWFAASGFLRIYYGVRRWSSPKTGSAWMIALGVASILVALLLWITLPQSAVWLPGVILGVDLLLWGSLLVAIGFAHGKMIGLAAS